MSFDKNFLDKIRKRLLDEKKQLEQDLADYVTGDGKNTKVNFPEYGDHVGENASEVASYDSDLSVKNTLEKSLRDINTALKRIEDGHYGICKYCGKEIAEKRIEARPTSSACVECKQKFSNK